MNKFKKNPNGMYALYQHGSEWRESASVTNNDLIGMKLSGFDDGCAVYESVINGDSVEAVVMSQTEYGELMQKVFKRQNALANNSNFYIKGFDRHVYATLLQAFSEELNLIKITDT